MSQQIDLVCDIDIAQTQESFHAHAIPEDIEINPGDRIQVHEAPTEIAFGEVFTGQRRATLTRASRLEQAWTAFRSIFEITELYEVGFQPADTNSAGSLKIGTRSGQIFNVNPPLKHSV